MAAGRFGFVPVWILHTNEANYQSLQKGKSGIKTVRHHHLHRQ